MRAHLRELLPDLDMDLVLEGGAGPLGQSLDIGSMTLGNRFAIHPMEGWDGTRDGGPTERTVRRWRRFGRNRPAMRRFGGCPPSRSLDRWRGVLRIFPACGRPVCRPRFGS